MNTYDVVVIGGGAAGLNAALILTRARRSVAVVDSGSPRNQNASNLHNFLSRDGMPPLELLAAGRAEVTGYGGTIISSTVTSVTPGFTVELANGDRLTARRVLLATGLRDDLPDIPGLAERWGRDVVACPYCHGYEVADHAIGVLGPAEQAFLVRQWSSDVVLFSPTAALPERERLLARGIRIVEGTVRRLVVEDDQIRGVELTDGRFVARNAVFVKPNFVALDELVRPLGYDPAKTGPFGQSNVPGVWVAGNVANPMGHLITSAAEGATAGAMINADLVQADTDRALAAFNGFTHELEREIHDAQAVLQQT